MSTKKVKAGGPPLAEKFEKAIEVALDNLRIATHELDSRSLSNIVAAYSTYKLIHRPPGEFDW